MSREEIIRMAREAGFTEGDISLFPDLIAHFAALVADAKREKLAAWMIKHSYATGHGDSTEDLLKELEWQIEESVKNEREACAKVCDQMFHDWCNQEFEDEDEAYRNKPDAEDCKKAIRERGNT